MDYGALLDLASSPETLERTTQYLTQKLGQFVRRGDRVMICFDTDSPNSLGSLLLKAVEHCEAHAVIWGPDLRWKNLMRQAFSCRAGVIIGPPLIILGLTKLSRAKATPLYIRHVMTAGYVCEDWMREGIINGLDCKTWGCLDYNMGPIVAGFSCKSGKGVHIRDDEYCIDICGDDGCVLPRGQIGSMHMYHRELPSVRIPIPGTAMLDERDCSCGCSSQRLVAMGPQMTVDRELYDLGAQIHQWSGVLDCWIRRGSNGLEIDVVVFPGERLPQLPSCAKLTIRSWDPNTDVPFWTVETWKNNVI